MTRRTLLPLLALLLGVAACSGQSNKSKPGPSHAVAPPSAAIGSPAQELAYGRAPVAGGGITYRPDVVLVGGGAAMVRSVSGDSLVWSIDARAPHLNELQPGKVMFLTGRAVGRVLKFEPQGDVVAVTLGPVDLTDVISDGDVEVHSALDTGAMSFQTYPEVPGVDESSAGGISSAPTEPPTSAHSLTANLAGRGSAPSYAQQPVAEPLPPPTSGSSVEASVGDWSTEVGRKVSGGQTEFSLKTGYKVGGSTVGLEFTATMVTPTVQASLGFRGGAVA